MSYLTITIFMGFSFIFLALEEFSNRPKKILGLLILTSFILLASFRSLSVPDTIQYLTSYQYLKLELSNIFSNSFEIGFEILSIFIKRFAGSNYILFFGVIAGTNLFLINKVITKYGMTLTIAPLIIYLSYYGFYFNFIILRAGLAFSLLMYSWSLFRNNKIASLILFFISVSFHQSALIGIIGYLVIIISRKVSSKSYIIWLIVIISLYFIRIDLLLYNFIVTFILENNLFVGNRFIFYITNIKFNEGISFRFLLNFIVVIFLIFTKVNKPNYYHDLLNIYMIGMTIVAFFSSFIWIERLSDFLIATNFILITLALNNLKDKYLKLLIILFIVSLNLTFILRIMY
jgi:hypothetical protein